MSPFDLCGVKHTYFKPCFVGISSTTMSDIIEERSKKHLLFLFIIYMQMKLTVEDASTYGDSITEMVCKYINVPEQDIASDFGGMTPIVIWMTFWLTS